VHGNGSISSPTQPKPHQGNSLATEDTEDTEKKNGVICGFYFSYVSGRGCGGRSDIRDCPQSRRTFGEGTKVAIELALMAADAGFIRTDEDAISIGGTGKRADTALVLQPVTSFRLFDLKVKEMIRKPHGMGNR